MQLKGEIMVIDYLPYKIGEKEPEAIATTDFFRRFLKEHRVSLKRFFEMHYYMFGADELSTNEDIDKEILYLINRDRASLFSSMQSWSNSIEGTRYWQEISEDWISIYHIHEKDLIGGGHMITLSPEPKQILFKHNGRVRPTEMMKEA